MSGKTLSDAARASKILSMYGSLPHAGMSIGKIISRSGFVFAPAGVLRAGRPRTNSHAELNSYRTVWELRIIR